jgi:hypothetical protein
VRSGDFSHLADKFFGPMIWCPAARHGTGRARPRNRFVTGLVTAVGTRSTWLWASSTTTTRPASSMTGAGPPSPGDLLVKSLRLFAGRCRFGDAKELMMGYAFLLTHPGVPCIFWQDWEDPLLRGTIEKLVAVRREARVSTRFGPPRPAPRVTMMTY